MPIYQKLGLLPHKRHTAMRKPDGSLYYEELMGNQGFTGPASLVYHLYRPTQLRSVRPLKDLKWESEPDWTLRHRHFRTHNLAACGSPTCDRAPVLFNADVAISVVQ